MWLNINHNNNNNEVNHEAMRQPLHWETPVSKAYQKNLKYGLLGQH